MPSTSEISLLVATATRVAAEIASTCSSAEWRLGIDDPVDPSELIEPLGERGEIGEIAKKAQVPGRDGSLRFLQKQAPEQ
ncbi:hypothetical protein XH84_10490 [Bradyrhizobium nanningense]|nr:hypothetical protein XH84_10490 [Bradyrhizobium nanningense]